MPQKDKPEPKVFCIGFNKTGTTSLHHYFEALGLKSAHNSFWPHDSYRRKNIYPPFRRATCFSDGECSDFERLRTCFPGSVFVLNTRKLRPWLHSRVKHAMQFGHPDRNPDAWKKMRWLGHEFFAGEVLAMDNWILRRAIYHRKVRRFFEGKEDFLEIDITTTEDWTDTVFSHLLDHGFVTESTPKPSYVRENVRLIVEVPDADLLNAYLLQADERIERMSELHPTGLDD